MNIMLQYLWMNEYVFINYYLLSKVIHDLIEDF